jgi:hypothetical protein
MDGTRRTSRRRVLAAGIGLAVGAVLPGCATERTPDESGDSTVTDATSATTLDLREANVVDVTVDSTDDAVAFDVTLHHDDEGEDGYANWWQVERLDGTRLGRRDLLHAHARQPFTRSATLDVPAGATCVVVRGHDQTHGYGGRVALVDVDVDVGATRFVDQGADRRSFDAADCP